MGNAIFIESDQTNQRCSTLEQAPTIWVGEKQALSLLGHVESTWEVLRSHDTYTKPTILPTLSTNALGLGPFIKHKKGVSDYQPHLTGHVARDGSRV